MVEETIQRRLEVLRQEFERGQRHLEALERERQEVRDTLLRIGGAIQVLEELTGQHDASRDGRAGPDALIEAPAATADAGRAGGAADRAS